MRRITPFVLLVAVCLAASPARAESVEARTKMVNTPTRIRGAVTVLPVPWGLVALGGSSLRHMRKGKTEWETLHRIEGDNLYRIAGDESGRLLASWEKDPQFHLFFTKTKEHLTFAKPARPSEEFRTFSLDDIYFSKDGTAAIVYMHGLTGGSVWTTVAYRYPLDGKSAPTMLFRQKGYELHNNARVAVFATSTNDSRSCDNNGCAPLSSVVAWEIDGGAATSTTLLAAKGEEYTIARMVWGSDEERVVMAIHGQRNTRQLLRWNVGDALAELSELPNGSSYSQATSRLTKAGVLVELWKGDGGGLEIRRYAPNGWKRTTTLAAFEQKDPDIPTDYAIYSLRERANGDLIMHWGDRLWILPAAGDARTFDVEPLLTRRTEWAGVMIYIPDPEGVWLGIEVGGGRDYVHVPFAEIDKRATVVKPAKPEKREDAP